MSLCKTPLLLALLLASAAHAAPIDYARDIAPLFDAHCIDCHAADDADGDFSLDTFAALAKGGKTGKAVEAGKSQDSLLVKFLEGRSGKSGKNQFMPPGKKEHLAPAQIAMIRQWIDEGAHGPSAGSAAPADPFAKLPKIASNTAIKPIRSVAVSPDGKIIALGRYGSIELLDGTSHKSLRSLAGIAGNPNTMTFSNDSHSLFIAAGDAGVSGIAYRFSTTDGTLTAKYQGHSDALYALALSPDGKQLATGGYDQKILLWDIATAKQTKLLKGHNGSVNALSYRPDGKLLASASADRTIKLWDTASGTRLDTLSQPTKEQFAVAFSHDGRSLVAAGADSRIRLWSVSAQATEGSTPIAETKFAHEGTILRLAYSPDGKSLLSSASDRGVKLWNASDITERHAFEKQSDWASAVAWAGNSQILAARQDGSAAMYDVSTGKATLVAMQWPAAARRLPVHRLVPPTVRCQAAKPKATAKAKAMAKAAATPPAKPGVPAITRLNPPGFQAGGTAVISVIGTGLDKVTTAKASDPRITFKLTLIKPTELWLEIHAPADLPRAAYDLSLVSPAGESAKIKFYADNLPITDLHSLPIEIPSTDRPSNVFGTLTAIGQRDIIIIIAHPGQTLTLDLAAKAIGSKLVNPRLELFGNTANGKRLAASSGLDSGSDPFIAYTVPAGDKTQYFHAKVSETTLDGSPDHVYRLTIGALPVVVGWWPLSVKANAETDIHLIGYNLKKTTTTVKAGASGEITLPLDTPYYRSRVPMKVLVSEMTEQLETDLIPSPAKTENGKRKTENATLPLSINGLLHNPASPDEADTDDYPFTAQKGELILIETQAAALGSPADTKLEVLDAQFKPVPRLLLQAVRDSWINFRSVDANNPDARVENWREMDLNQYIYFQGDIARIFRLPRGPDSGFLFYGFGGKRRAYFDTTATGHALDEPCYVVEPQPLGTTLPSTGLPVFTLHYTNDDASDRRSGSDSRLFFTAPVAGQYIVRVSDSRGLSGERFAYRLTLRKPQPDFALTLVGDKPILGPGASIGFSVKATRKDGFEGPITVTLAGIPPGYYASTPLIIEAGAEIANGSLFAAPTAAKNADWSQVKVTATATIDAQQITRPGNPFTTVTLTDKPKVLAILEPAVKERPAHRPIAENLQPLEVTIAPGETKAVWLRAERDGNNDLLNFDIHNLPFGIIIDNIGLSGVAVRAGESEREVFLTAAKWVPEQDRLCHAAVNSARAEQDSAGVQTSYPVLLKVRKATGVVAQ